MQPLATSNKQRDAMRTQAKPLFGDLIDGTPGLAQELEVIDAQADRHLQLLAIPTQQRLEIAIESAKEAFWAAIAGQFPEVVSGDMSAESAYKFDIAASRAAYDWLQANHQGNRIDSDPRSIVIGELGGIVARIQDPAVWYWHFPSEVSDTNFGVAFEALESCWDHISTLAIDAGLTTAAEWSEISVEQQCEIAKKLK